MKKLKRIKDNPLDSFSDHPLSNMDKIYIFGTLMASGITCHMQYQSHFHEKREKVGFLTKINFFGFPVK